MPFWITQYSTVPPHPLARMVSGNVFARSPAGHSASAKLTSMVPDDVCVAVDDRLAPHLTRRDYVTLADAQYGTADFVGVDFHYADVGNFGPSPAYVYSHVRRRRLSRRLQPGRRDAAAVTALRRAVRRLQALRPRQGLSRPGSNRPQCVRPKSPDLCTRWVHRFSNHLSEVSSMKSLVRLATLAGVAGVAVAALTTAFAGPASATPVHSPAQGAVFVLTDGLGANAVVAYDRATDGALTLAHSYPTGGTGGRLGVSVADHTASEGSLTLDAGRSLLYAVNPGSNTLSVFRVSGDRLAEIQTVASGGAFPVSVAVSGPFVYVLNALNGGSVQGYFATAFGLIPVPSWNRTLGLPTTTPTAQAFTVPPSQVLFSPDGRQLLVNTKAGTDSVLAFRVGSFGLSGPTVNALPAGAVPFGATFDRAGHLVVIGAGDTTLRTFALAASGHLTAIGSPVVVGQAGSCWVTTNGRYLFVSNAGAGTETAFSTTAAGHLSDLGSVAVDAGTVDAAATPDGKWLYVQGGADGTVTGFKIAGDGTLSKVAPTLVVPGAAGGEGIVAS